MRVFILCTGRSGSQTIIKGCKHIKNYTSGHESLAKVFGSDRFLFPENHIEADNRLSWQLGLLNKIYKDDAFYVHLKRNRDNTAASFMKRYYQPGSIIDSYCEGIKKIPPEKLDHDSRLKACYDYIDTVNSNIEFFLSDKSNTIILNLENIVNDFPKFWDKIGAEGDLDRALEEFKIKHNVTSKRRLDLLYRSKLIIQREWRHIAIYLKQSN